MNTSVKILVCAAGAVAVSIYLAINVHPFAVIGLNVGLGCGALVAWWVGD